MLGFKYRYQLNEWKLMGTGHAAEMKESDRKGTLPGLTSVRECLLPAVALEQNLQTKLNLSIVG
jgi:hypothetical protein